MGIDYSLKFLARQTDDDDTFRKISLNYTILLKFSARGTSNKRRASTASE